MEGDIFNFRICFFSKAVLKCPAGNGARRKPFSRKGECCRQRHHGSALNGDGHDIISHILNSGVLAGAQDNELTPAFGGPGEGVCPPA